MDEESVILRDSATFPNPWYTFPKTKMGSRSHAGSVARNVQRIKTLGVCIHSIALLSHGGLWWNYTVNALESLLYKRAAVAAQKILASLFLLEKELT